MAKRNPGLRWFLYLMRADDGLYKIGVSSNPQRRRETIARHMARYENGCGLTLLTCILIGVVPYRAAVAVERAVHRRFAHCQLRRTCEWFWLTPAETKSFASIARTERDRFRVDVTNPASCHDMHMS